MIIVFSSTREPGYSPVEHASAFDFEHVSMFVYETYFIFPRGVDVCVRATPRPQISTVSAFTHTPTDGA